MTRNSDYDQLLGMLKACEALEREVYELNRRKTKIMREATACGFNRVALRHLLRIRRDGKCPDDHVPGTYEGLVDEIEMAKYLDGGTRDGSNDS